MRAPRGKARNIYKPWSSVGQGCPPPERPAKLRTPQECFVCLHVMAVGTMPLVLPAAAMAAHRLLGRTHGQRLPRLITYQSPLDSEVIHSPITGIRCGVAFLGIKQVRRQW